MKSIVEYIIESSKAYYIEWVDKNGHRHSVTTNSLNDKPKESDVKYYAVMNNQKSNFSEPDALIEWGGTGEYWANTLDRAENPEKYPEKIYGKPFKGRDLEKIKRCKKF